MPSWPLPAMATRYPSASSTSATELAKSRSSSTIKMSFAMSSLLRLCRARLVRAVRELRWQLDGEEGPLAKLALDMDRSTVCLDDLVNDVETEAQAAVRPRWRCLLEAMKDPFEVLRG